MTGSPPKNMRFKLMSEDPTASMMVRIAYPSADSRQVLLNERITDRLMSRVLFTQ